MNSREGTAARAKEVPQPDIRVTATRVARISEVEQSEFSHNGAYSVHDSIVIEFTNQSKQHGAGGEPRVRALLTYKDTNRELLQITGGWIDNASDVAEFKSRQTHGLLLGFLHEGNFVAVELVTAIAQGGEEYLQRQHALKGFQHGTVLVTLMDANTRQLVYDGYFEIGVNPLRVSQIPVTSS